MINLKRPYDKYIGKGFWVDISGCLCRKFTSEPVKLKLESITYKVTGDKYIIEEMSFGDAYPRVKPEYVFKDKTSAFKSWAKLLEAYLKTSIPEQLSNINVGITTLQKEQKHLKDKIRYFNDVVNKYKEK